MRYSRPVYLLLCSSLVSAVPTLQVRNWLPFAHGPNKVTEYIDYGKRIAAGTTCECDLQRAKMPICPSPLPEPASNLKLSHVAIGRGTQNYTCDLSNSTAIPVAVGAVASLFNVSCLAVESPGLVVSLPIIALDLPVPFTPSSKSDSTYFDLSGHHYFLNSTTAFFNLDTSAHQYGFGAFKKANSSAAPTTALAGPGGRGNGAVPWLKLGALDISGQAFQEVYRVNTAGGNPPKTCQGQRASIEVPYAAEYWLYT